MTYSENQTYKINPEIEESEERYIFSHYNEFGSAFFHTVGKPTELDKMFWLSSTEVEEEILILA